MSTILKASCSSSQTLLRVAGSSYSVFCRLLHPVRHLTTHPLFAGVRPFRAKFRSNRSLATVADPPVRRYGGLKDQDRIFTNVYCRHDHGIKGALASCLVYYSDQPFSQFDFFSLEAIGIVQRIFYSREILGLFKPSKIRVFVVVVVLVSRVV